MAAFTKLKSFGLPKASAKFAKLSKERKLSLPKIKAPKTPSLKSPKPFDFNKFTKPVKLPKAPKITLIKKAIKKVKPKGF